MEIKYIIIVISIIKYSTAAKEDKLVVSDDPSAKQLKRGTPELSYSYAATDIGNKAGTHVKTITIIKNYGHKDKPIMIDPELHKDEDWGSKFRDNFDSFGKIPEIPDVFSKKKDSSVEKETSREEIPIKEISENKQVQENKAVEMQTPTNEDESDQISNSNEEKEEPSKEKKGNDSKSELKTLPADVELIETPSNTNKQKGEGLKSQPLIALFPSNIKPHKYVHYSSAVLHTQPYHQISKASISKPSTSHINQKEVSHFTGFPPYKVPEIYKTITYSPLLFPPIKIEAIENNRNPYLVPSTTPITRYIGKSQIILTSSQAPYIAPNLKKSSTSPSSTASPTSNFINTKVRNKLTNPTRSRGLRY